MFPCQRQRALGSRLLQQGVVQEGQNDVDMSGFDGASMKFVLTHTETEVPDEPFLFHLYQFVQSVTGGEGILNVNRIVD